MFVLTSFALDTFPTQISPYCWTSFVENLCSSSVRTFLIFAWIARTSRRRRARCARASFAA